MLAALSTIASASCRPADRTTPSDAPADTKPIDEVYAELMPHKGYVFLDSVAGVQQLTHCVTVERITLPSDRRWRLEFDDDGFGACIAEQTAGDEESVIKFVEDELLYQVYKTDGNGMHISCDRGPHKGEVVDLEAFSKKYVVSTMTWMLGRTRAPATFDLAVFRWVRAGARIYVSLKSIYEKLGFEQFAGRSWIWVANQRGAWERLLRKFQCQGHIASSTQVGKQKTRTNDPKEKGVLPFNAISLFGLLHLLVKWSYCPPRAGGLCDEDNVSAANSMLTAFLSGIAAWRPSFTMHVELDRHWVNSWPRPPTRSLPVALTLEAGMVDLSVWSKLADGGPQCSCVHTAWRRLQVHLGGRTRVPLADFVKALALTKSLTATFADLVWQLGAMLQDGLLRALKGEKVARVEASRVCISDMFFTKDRLDAELVRYLESCRVVTRNHQQYVSMCTDKAAVGGFSMQAGLIVLPSGEGLVPPPQAVP